VMSKGRAVKAAVDLALELEVWLAQFEDVA
jgi:hypothetical protein